MHLAHPLGNNWGHRRLTNDQRDAEDLVDLLRLGRLAESDVAPPPLRELRELVRYRAKIVALRSGLKAQVRAVLAKEGVAVGVSDLFGLAGTRLLETTPLGRSYRLRVDSLRDLILTFGEQIEMLEGEIEDSLAGRKGYLAIQAIPGVGRVLAAVFCATLHRFDKPRHRLERSERHLGLNGTTSHQRHTARRPRPARLAVIGVPTPLADSSSVGWTSAECAFSPR